MPGISPDHHDAPLLKRSILRSILAFLLVSSIFAIVWVIFINPYYFPFGDSFSVFVNSIPAFHPSIGSWFLHGFQTYFDVYPDISLHSTNFVRPVVNGTFFLGWFLWGAHWSRYLLTTYIIIGLIAAAVCFLCSYILRLDWRLTLLATICVAVAPSVDSGALTDPTFAFDLLAGLLVLLGVTALIFDALLPAWLLFTLAVFTKETALFAPILAAAILFVRKREKNLAERALTTIAFLLPVAAWFLLRSHDFQGEKGVYVFMDGSSHSPLHVMIVRILLGLTTWPIAAIVYGNSVPTVAHLLQKLTLALNILFWPVLAVLVLKALFKDNTLRPSDLPTSLRAGKSKRRYAITLLILFSAISLLTPLALNVPRRFGGVFYPLFLLALACAAQYLSQRLLRIAATTMIAATGIAGATLLVSDIVHMPALHSTWTLSRNYISTLASSTEPVLFLVDDLSGRYSSSEYVQRFAGYKGQLIRVNDISWNYACNSTPHVTIDPLPNGDVTITSLFPKQCGGYSFNSVFPPVDPNLTILTRTLPASTLRYTLTPKPGDTNILRVELHSWPPGSAILYADPLALTYRRIALPSHP